MAVAALSALRASPPQGENRVRDSCLRRNDGGGRRRRRGRFRLDWGRGLWAYCRRLCKKWSLRPVRGTMEKQTQQQASTPDYTMGFGEEFMEALRRFTAQANAEAPAPATEGGPAGPRFRLRAGHHIRRAGEGGEAGRTARRGHGGVAGRAGALRRAGARRGQRDVPRGRHHGHALRGRLLRRGALPERADARAGHAGGAGGGEAGAEARRAHQLPRDDQRVQLHPAGLRGNRHRRGTCSRT